MKTKIFYLSIIAFLFVVGCSDDDDINFSLGEMQLELPSQLGNATSKITVTIENVNTGAVVQEDVNNLVVSNLSLEDGVYNIVARGTATYMTHYVIKKKDDEGNISEESIAKEITSDIVGAKENVEIKDGAFTVSIPLFLASKSEGFVISEIFFSWSKTPENKPYYYDSFFELYNNSNEVLYADGLCIGETKLKTAHTIENYSPDIRNEAVPLRTVYRIPGSGKEHAVQPGETFVFCDIAIDHSAENPNSIDLSKADFEWYDVNKRDTDTPEVSNMERLVVENANTVWKPFSKGQHSYVLFRVENTVSAEQFATNQAYHYEFTLNGEVYSKDVWKIENDKVIDAVECSTPSAFEWKALSPSLDLTWTHSGDSDDARYGHSVKRRISHMDGDRIVLQDTNDSASDFIATAPNPSPGDVSDHK